VASSAPAASKPGSRQLTTAPPCVSTPAISLPLASGHPQATRGLNGSPMPNDGATFAISLLNVSWSVARAGLASTPSRARPVRNRTHPPMVVSLPRPHRRASAPRAGGDDTPEAGRRPCEQGHFHRVSPCGHRWVERCREGVPGLLALRGHPRDRVGLAERRARRPPRPPAPGEGARLPDDDADGPAGARDEERVDPVNGDTSRDGRRRGAHGGTFELYNQPNLYGIDSGPSLV